MKRALFALALASVAWSDTAIAAACWNRTVTEAAQIRQFDIMMMVSTIRCFRKGVDFSNDYNQFVKGKRAVLRAVGDEIIRHMNGTMGGKAALAAYDRFSVVMANQFGDGVEGLECEDLRVLVAEANQAVASRDHLVGLAQRAGMEPPLPAPRCETPAPSTVIASAAPIAPIAAMPVNATAVAVAMPASVLVPVPQATDPVGAAAIDPAKSVLAAPAE